MSDSLPVVCSRETAERIDKQLRNQARGVAHSLERFKTLIDEAKDRRIYIPLGFKSWTAYIADAIGKEMHQLPVDDRRQIVALLAGEGMSQRAIADALGVNHATVSRDQAAIEAEQVLHDAPPEPVNLDEQMQLDVAPEATPLPPEEQASLRDSLASDREKLTKIIEGEKAARGTNLRDRLAPVIGIDGKRYPAQRPPAPLAPPTPPHPRRGAITESFHRATNEIRTRAERLTRLADDDRFSRNRATLVQHDLSNLKLARDALNDVIAQLERDS